MSEKPIQLTPYTKEDSGGLCLDYIEIDRNWNNCQTARHIFWNTFDPESWEKFRRKQNET